MNAKLLIDSIVHQTTVLIGQLSTAAGLRAPLAHIADQVFLELSREIEAQGVSRKVAADMFGMALRTYQKKVQRVSAGTTVRDRTLWQAVLEFLTSRGSASRRALLEEFSRDDPVNVGSVLNDLVASGLVSRTGSGEATVFTITQESEFLEVLRAERRETLAPIAWALVYRSGGMTRAALRDRLAVPDGELGEALDLLEREGRIERTGAGDAASYHSSFLVLPLEAEHGWEAAVFDHFQALVRAVGVKLRRGTPRAHAADVTGGATLTFVVDRDHPLREEALGLLRRVRTDVNDLWQRVQAHNATHELSEDQTEILFYFGQAVTDSDDE
ncbi:MAG TPA: hypothetical protein VGK73_17770 [Polyangiaceae bacterium]